VREVYAAAVAGLVGGRFGVEGGRFGAFGGKKGVYGMVMVVRKGWYNGRGMFVCSLQRLSTLFMMQRGRLDYILSIRQQNCGG